MNPPFRTVRWLTKTGRGRHHRRPEEPGLGIEHVAGLGYFGHFVGHFIVGYIDIDFVQREQKGINAFKKAFYSLLDRVFQVVH